MADKITDAEEAVILKGILYSQGLKKKFDEGSYLYEAADKALDVWRQALIQSSLSEDK